MFPALAVLASALGAAAAVSAQELVVEPPADLAGPVDPSGVPEVGSEPEELFFQANRSYEEGDFARAAEGYRRLLGLGLGDGYLYYNLGNAYLRNGELGRAIAAYLESRSRRPRDRDVLANLSFARRSRKDAIAPPEPSTAVRTLLFWHFALSGRELVGLAVALNLLFWTALALRLKFATSETLRWVVLGLAIPLVAVGGSLLARQSWPAETAVVIPQEIEAHTGPETDTVVRFKLHAGTEVEVEERRDGWLRISLPDGQQGWIEARSATVVRG